MSQGREDVRAVPTSNPACSSRLTSPGRWRPAPVLATTSFMKLLVEGVLLLFDRFLLLLECVALGLVLRLLLVLVDFLLFGPRGLACAVRVRRRRARLRLLRARLRSLPATLRSLGVRSRSLSAGGCRCQRSLLAGTPERRGTVEARRAIGHSRWRRPPKPSTQNESLAPRRRITRRPRRSNPLEATGNSLAKGRSPG